jgi:hypothetical protein
MKASILLDGECLDSRIKISTMLMEMDELDKVTLHCHRHCCQSNTLTRACLLLCLFVFVYTGGSAPQ